MKSDPCIIIHNLSEGITALRAALECKQSVILLSSPEAASYLSPLVFKAIVDQASMAVPNALFKAMFDCGDQPGLVMNALRHGIKLIRANLQNDIYEKLKSVAKRSNAIIIKYEKICNLDLNKISNDEIACQEWLKKQINN